jgi:iron complex outermembrane recepter protein
MKKIVFGFIIVIFSLTTYAQEIKKDSAVQIEEVIIKSVRAGAKDPIVTKNIQNKELKSRNLAQDIPILLNYLPSVVSTSDAGAGVGYTYMRVRGADGSRTNVTLNGIPFNDSESHGTFFVNLPDFASSVENIQLQRGVGASTNGAGAFGASLNMQTKAIQKNAFAEIAATYGSFNTQKQSISFSTGLHNNLEANARISRINTDGYIDRASVNLFGYFYNINYQKNNTLLKFIAFGGKEKTYQAWYGLEDTEKLQNDRTYNIAGLYTNEFGNTQFHGNETDNYWQNHFQFIWNQKIKNKWQSNMALHYTLGKGYFEQYKEDDNFAIYNLPDFGSISFADIIRKRWLDNDFFGATYALSYQNQTTNFTLGTTANRYLGKHFGEVVWTQYYVPSFNRYYNNFGNKDEVSAFAKVNQQIQAFNFYADLQYRYIHYTANSFRFSPVNDTFEFINPKIGFTYQPNTKNSFFAYYGIANKEPRRDDYENGSIKPERLQDLELGYKFANKELVVNANAFYMRYKNQLVATGALNDVGSPVFANSGDSYRAGIEVDAQIEMVAEKFYWMPNFTFSQNKNIDFYFKRDDILQNLGNTNIAYSPNVVVGNVFKIVPIQNLQINLLTKYVGKQYLGNIDANKSVLKAYSVTDLNVSYQIPFQKSIETITCNVLVNNLFNAVYESNGYFYTYDDDFTNPPAITTIEGVGFYPQAGINVLAGITVRFR